ncbi:MAG: hypothetical protein ACTMUB_02625 [cyanobacterium endosymbiont of Rhopalodia musculus]
MLSTYPIIPCSPRGELADTWASQGELNFRVTVPSVAEMQSKGCVVGVIN